MFGLVESSEENYNYYQEYQKIGMDTQEVYKLDLRIQFKMIESFIQESKLSNTEAQVYWTENYSVEARQKLNSIKLLALHKPDLNQYNFYKVLDGFNQSLSVLNTIHN